MVNLTEYEDYWEQMLVRVPEIKDVYFLTSETDIQSEKASISASMQPFLMVILPSAISKGSYDNAEEDNAGLIYLYSKEDNRTKSFELQKSLQPIMEKIKYFMREDIRSCTSVMRYLDFASMQTDPERKMFGDLTGWSLSFIFESE